VPAAEHRLQDADGIRPRPLNDDHTGAVRERICGAMRRIAGDNERCTADEAPQSLVKRCWHHCRGVTSRAGSVIEELYVKVLPAAFESHEEEPRAAHISVCGKTGGHSFEAGHTNRSRTGSKYDSVHGCKSNADTGETTGSDRRRYDVKRYRRQP
jgi:hypothetical protein